MLRTDIAAVTRQAMIHEPEEKYDNRISCWLQINKKIIKVHANVCKNEHEDWDANGVPNGDMVGIIKGSNKLCHEIIGGHHLPKRMDHKVFAKQQVMISLLLIAKEHREQLAM